ncbi:phage tail protein [Nannocystaceae bacterium ST9]
MEAFLGSIILFGGNFAPRGWALCNGQLLSIAQNSALFSILGTTYGGDGQVTFGLPDLRGRMPIQQGSGPGLTPRQLGEMAGSESASLLIGNIPAHGHLINALSSSGDQASPAGHFPAGGGTGTLSYSSRFDATMNPTAVSSSGGSQPFSTESPFLALNFIIALTGIYPSRN